MNPSPIYVLMPVLAGRDLTEAAVSDVLAQSVPTRLLLINQGVDTDFRVWMERLAEQEPTKVLVWSHTPPLLSLAATWNRALDFVWETGGTEALLVNNDVRLHRQTVEGLGKVQRLTSALFVSAVGVTPAQFDPGAELILADDPDAEAPALATGGPDFSCFLITRACHTRFRFDESFRPAYLEDLDYHRRLLLAGAGARIFSVNLPFAHVGSGTLKDLSPGTRRRIEQAITDGSRAYYRRKWGGDANQETFFSPFDEGVEGIATAGMPTPPTTPALQQWARETRLDAWGLPQSTPSV